MTAVIDRVVTILIDAETKKVSEVISFIKRH